MYMEYKEVNLHSAEVFISVTIHGYMYRVINYDIISNNKILGKKNCISWNSFQFSDSKIIIHYFFL